MLPTPLAPLAAWPQFVVWRLVDGKKLPYSPVHGGLASSTNPKDWGSYEQAAAAGAGIGFVFTAADPFWFLDIDGAWNAAQQAWSPTALEICAALPGAAMEVSQSGTGLHLIGTGTPPADHANKNTPLHLELYTKERFVALTGTNAQGSAATDLTGPLAQVAAKYFTRSTQGRAAEWTTEPVEGWKGPTDDDALLERAMRSGGQSAASAFGSGSVAFADLFTADVDALGARWPSSTGQAYDASSADQAFANLLAFWTGKDCERMERIMRMSSLARGKWDDHATYLQNTILNAVGAVSNVYVEREQRAEPPRVPVEPPEASPDTLIPTGELAPRAGGPMLSGAQQKMFAGCVYVISVKKIFTPTGRRLEQGSFDTVFGGYDFVLDSVGKKTTRSAWEAYRTNENYAPDVVDKLCFRPELGSGGIIEEGKETFLNTYIAIDTASTAGDPSPFLDLMRKQLPVERDRAILLNYLASVVQNPGMKAQWWPVLQGTKGNGKTVYLTIMEHCVGKKYTHLPGVGKMVRNGMNFNGWIAGKLFLGLEEIKGSHRREFFEEFKTTVTNGRLSIEGKGIEEETGENRANGLMTTNHKDGVPIDDGERRYGIFFMAQQTVQDMQRDGMTPAYFADFHDWLYGRNAYAVHGADYGLRVVNNYLKTFPLVAELDPNRLATWAPQTSSTLEAVQSSRGRAEQEVQEAIEEERVGFAGGWVSSYFLDRLLDTTRANIPRNKRREVMQSLGYDYHPALPDGRCHSVVQPDNSRPRLYIKNGHISRNIENQTEAAKAYTKAQGGSGAQAAFGT